MKFYLSSSKFSDQSHKLAGLMPATNKKIGYIPNALDYTGCNIPIREQKLIQKFKYLTELGLEPEMLDLRDYFGKETELKTKLQTLGGVFINGGNTFILRQAMRISGFDKILTELKEQNADFLYAGYSAACCILAADMRGLQIVDDPNDHPYKEIQETIFEGLGFLDYMILPHFNSNHPEAEDISKEVQYCKQNKIPYKTLNDGDVIIID
ncbi:type 1 glutamine amidotransferase-like domain-containing protein [archaeon]|jgi:dipeptidase E|nr:type 1 glutamine amidotransferase-like domain-containing protein [archaeon]MBT6762549.1 type 1 glutamine amidotransferase-like domain-containing protein [archaeon]